MTRTVGDLQDFSDSMISARTGVAELLDSLGEATEQQDKLIQGLISDLDALSQIYMDMLNILRKYEIEGEATDVA